MLQGLRNKKYNKKTTHLILNEEERKSYIKKKTLFSKKGSYLLEEKSWCSDIVLEMHNLNRFHGIKIHVSKFPTLQDH